MAKSCVDDEVSFFSLAVCFMDVFVFEKGVDECFVFSDDDEGDLSVGREVSACAVDEFADTYCADFCRDVDGDECVIIVGDVVVPEAREGVEFARVEAGIVRGECDGKRVAVARVHGSRWVLRFDEDCDGSVPAAEVEDFRVIDRVVFSQAVEQ